jgi:hypothetical protein
MRRPVGGNGVFNVGFGADAYTVVPISREEGRSEPPSAPHIPQPFTKEEYTSIVRRQRTEFVYKQFGNVLSSLDKFLKEDAEKMRHCRREVTFEIPDHFDIDRMEAVLTSHFVDIGYKPLVEPRDASEETIKKIVITLT